MSVNQRGYILFDDHHRDHLLPFTFIRPVAEIRIGILTMREKWERFLHHEVSHFTQEYLQEKYPLVISDQNIVINGSVAPNEELVNEVLSLQTGEALVKGTLLVAACLDRPAMESFDRDVPPGFIQKNATAEFLSISRPWHLFRQNGDHLVADFKLVTSGRTSAPISPTNNIIGAENVFVEEGAQLEYVTINASNGPVYLGRNSVIMEGALIRGPFALCEGAVVKMGARIYGHNTIGPYAKAGGEITNSVIMAYSNKVHDGYLGNSVIGEWCNIGAGTNTSNLKNNYTLVKLWSYVTGKAEDTGLQFCGLIMGDFSRCGINTMFTTGTLVGVSTNIYGSGFPGNFIPSFSWGGAAGFETYRLGEAVETIQTGLSFRQMVLSETDRKIIGHVFTLTGRYRSSV